MKCVVHLDIDPDLHVFASAAEAVEFAERELGRLNSADADPSDPPLTLLWQRPAAAGSGRDYTFEPYTRDLLAAALAADGEVTLQFVGGDLSDPAAGVHGVIATIVEFERNARETAANDAALARFGQEMADSCGRPLTIGVTGQKVTYTPTRKAGG